MVLLILAPVPAWFKLSSRKVGTGSADTRLSALMRTVLRTETVQCARKVSADLGTFEGNGKGEERGIQD